LGGKAINLVFTTCLADGQRKHEFVDIDGAAV